MKTTFRTISQLLARPEQTPIPLDVFPDRMGINLVSVEGLSWTRQEDGQLVSLTVHFLPSDDRLPPG